MGNSPTKGDDDDSLERHPSLSATTSDPSFSSASASSLKERTFELSSSSSSSDDDARPGSISSSSDDHEPAGAHHLDDTFEDACEDIEALLAQFSNPSKISTKPEEASLSAGTSQVGAIPNERCSTTQQRPQIPDGEDRTSVCQSESTELKVPEQEQGNPPSAGLDETASVPAHIDKDFEDACGEVEALLAQLSEPSPKEEPEPKTQSERTDDPLQLSSPSRPSPAARQDSVATCIASNATSIPTSLAAEKTAPAPLPTIGSIYTSRADADEDDTHTKHHPLFLKQAPSYDDLLDEQTIETVYEEHTVLSSRGDDDDDVVTIDETIVSAQSAPVHRPSIPLLSPAAVNPWLHQTNDNEKHVCSSPLTLQSNSFEEFTVRTGDEDEIELVTLDDEPADWKVATNLDNPPPTDQATAKKTPRKSYILFDLSQVAELSGKKKHELQSTSGSPTALTNTTCPSTPSSPYPFSSTTTKPNKWKNRVEQTRQRRNSSLHLAPPTLGVTAPVVTVSSFDDDEKPAGALSTTSTLTLPSVSLNETDKEVLTSTLSAIPGRSLIESHAMIWSSCTQQLDLKTMQQENGMDLLVDELVQRAHVQLRAKAPSCCNAILGITTTIATDTTSAQQQAGGCPWIIVSLSGTPCKLS